MLLTLIHNKVISIELFINSYKKIKKKRAKKIVCALNFEHILIYIWCKKIIFYNDTFEDIQYARVAYIIIKIFHKYNKWCFSTN